MDGLSRKEIAKGKIKRNKKLFLIFVLLILNILIPGVLITASVYSLNNGVEFVYTKKPSVSASFVEHEITAKNVHDVQNQIAEKKEELRKKQEREENIRKTEALLARYNSPMQGYGEIIVRRAEECGGDYKVLMGIAGNESGFGRIPYKRFNPYGYLDGVQYSGWDTSLDFLSCRIAQRFLVPCNNDLTCIINKYGGSDTNRGKWISNVQFFINQLQ